MALLIVIICSRRVSVSRKAPSANIRRSLLALSLWWVQATAPIATAVSNRLIAANEAYNCPRRPRRASRPGACRCGAGVVTDWIMDTLAGCRDVGIQQESR